MPQRYTDNRPKLRVTTNISLKFSGTIQTPAGICNDGMETKTAISKAAISLSPEVGF